MSNKLRRKISARESDPFGESSLNATHKTFDLLGARFEFESNNERLLRLVDHAYAGLPRHRFSSIQPQFKVRLMVTPAASVRLHSGLAARRRQPPPFSMLHGAGFLGGATPDSAFVVLSPQERSALISVSPQMLRFPYHTRYELIEFAVFTLASRARNMVSLHAACVGLNGRGILLMGPSGSGKSTVALHCLLNGFEFLSEDSVFVAPRTMLATATSNFLHVRADSLPWLGRSRHRRVIRKSPVIRRRSGIAKYEVDLRRKEFRLAESPLKIVAVGFLSSTPAGSGTILNPLPEQELRARLSDLQAYAARLPQWNIFSERLSRLGAFEIRRGSHPLQTVEALRSLFEG
jgi:hypothetical protein